MFRDFNSEEVIQKDDLSVGKTKLDDLVRCKVVFFLIF